MMEDELVGAILKSDVQREDDTAPPVALWYLWFCISWKADRSMMHLLEKIGNISWGYFGSLVFGGGNAAISGHGLPLG